MENRLLSCLSATDLASLALHVNRVALAQGAVLYEPEADIHTVYLPLSGAISLLKVMKDGGTIEVACIGREGAVGVSAHSGPWQAFTRAIVQVPSSAIAIPSTVLRTMISQSAHMRDLVVRYTSFVAAQTEQLAACNVFHSLEKRMARWLLQLSDRIGGSDLLTTQDTISEILGVRRTSVTLVAHKLRREGVIHYSRGHITIRQPKALQALACECYETGRRAEAFFEQHDLPSHLASGAAR